MKKIALVITSIANDQHPVLAQYAKEAARRDIPFIVIGDEKSPREFFLAGCDFYSLERQRGLEFALAKSLPTRHYARKNLGYLQAIKSGASVIVETDDDNIPFDGFWADRSSIQNAHPISQSGWVNVYGYFSDQQVWPRGYALDHLQRPLPEHGSPAPIQCPVQQGLADDNPDVDAIYRLTLPLPLKFNVRQGIALGAGSVCPFNSQNTTWFEEAFPLLYLPSYCSFRMTDIWRSFVAQRVLWTCGWSVLFHNSTVRQERNHHNLIKDFEDEVIGYVNNAKLMDLLEALDLEPGPTKMGENLRRCYSALCSAGLVGPGELALVDEWVADVDRAMQSRKSS